MSNLTRQMHSDGKKRRSFLALLFSAGDLQRCAAQFRPEHRAVKAFPALLFEGEI